jgi:Flp pilus assembly protein TadG
MYRHKTRGQSLVELALVTPLLLLILLFTADFARAFSAHIEIGNAAREGANVGSRTYITADNPALIEEAVRQESGAIFGSYPTVTSQVGTDTFGYDFVEVHVSYLFEPLIDLPGLPSQVTLQRSVQMRVLEV